MRTKEEIIKRIEERKSNDIFGWEIGELIQCLPFEEAEKYLSKQNDRVVVIDGSEKPNKDTWKQDSYLYIDVLERMQNYMNFAWEKANDCRGLSASRSYMHYLAWIWLAGDEITLSDIFNTSNYKYYGKLQLVRICEHYGWDWKKFDNDIWINNTTDIPLTAKEALEKELAK